MKYYSNFRLAAFSDKIVGNFYPIREEFKFLVTDILMQDFTGGGLGNRQHTHTFRLPIVVLAGATQINSALTNRIGKDVTNVFSRQFKQTT